MSSGGQSGVDLSGITSMRIQNASDVTRQKQFQLSFQDFYQVSSNQFPNHYFFNSVQHFREAINGIKESCLDCSGLPYVGFGVSHNTTCTTDSVWSVNQSGSANVFGGPPNWSLTTGTSSPGSYSYIYKRFDTPSSIPYSYSWSGSGTNYAWAVVTNINPSNVSDMYAFASDIGNIVPTGTGDIIPGPVNTSKSTTEPCQWVVLGVFTPDGNPPSGQFNVQVLA